jgi:hypothetical protein
MGRVAVGSQTFRGRRQSDGFLIRPENRLKKIGFGNYEISTLY